MTGLRVIVAALFLVASTLVALPRGGAAEPAPEPDLKPGEFIPAETPQPAPEMAFAGLDGQPVAIVDFKGKVLILNLWATWCAPCLTEMPSLERLEAKFGPDLAVLAVSEDHGGAEVVAPFLAKHDFKLKIALDPKSEAIHALHVRGLPTSLVVGRDGNVLGKVEGGADWDSEALQSVLMKLLSVSPPKS
jgi:thiol-disulfide isomerase/thioredoxin